MQPVSATFIAGRRRLRPWSAPSLPSMRNSACRRTLHELRMTMSANSSSLASCSPASCKAAATRAESAWFIWQPTVQIK